MLAYWSTLDKNRIDWLAPANEHHVASFPMVPFCSRIEHGRFTFEHRKISLPANNPPEPHAIHGWGYQRRWQLDSHTKNEACLTLEQSAGEWPWRHDMRQWLALHMACYARARGRPLEGGDRRRPV